MSCGCTATIEQEPFTVRIGDTYRFAVAVVDQFEQPASIDGAILDFGYGVRSDEEDRENAALPSAQPDAGTETRNGIVFPTIEITMPQSETSLLVDGVIYFWAARVTISGVVKTVATGSFTAMGVPF